MARRKRFGEILVEAGILTEVILQRALARQKKTGGRLGEVLEAMGVISESEAAAALGRQFGFPTVREIEKRSFPPQLLALVDAKTALEKFVFPLKVEGRTLYLAMSNPLDMETIDALAFRTSMRVSPVVAAPGVVLKGVRRHYGTEEAPFPNAVLPHGWTVLVAEDQELVRGAILAALKKEGYHVLEATDGAVALQMALQSPPHLILTDTVMPRMNGYEMFRALQANATTRDIPVLALSSRSTPEEEAKLLEMGYYDFIAKPINPVRLLARVKRALRGVYGTEKGRN